jgi:hypothetical protein
VRNTSSVLLDLPQGAISEVCGPWGSGKTEAVLHYLAGRPETRVAWVEERFTAFPRAFSQTGVGLERVLFVEGAAETLWTTHQLLRSQLFPVVVLGAEVRTEIELRRLQLDAEKACAALVLLTVKPRSDGAWAIAARFSVCRDPQSGAPQISVLKHRKQRMAV